jgi:hypothetical protein
MSGPGPVDSIIDARRATASVARLDSRQYFNLLVGALPNPFPSDEARWEAWELHRNGLLAARGPGSRPEGFWDYEAGPGAPDRGDYAEIGPVDPAPHPNELDGDARFELARVVFLAGHEHMDVAEARAFVRESAGRLKPSDELIGAYYCDSGHNEAVHRIWAVMEAFSAEDFTGQLGARLGWLVLGPDRPRRESP